MVPEPGGPGARRRVALLNENMSGHATFHRNLVSLLEHSGRLELRTVDTPSPSILRRLLTSPLPLPPGWDFDLPLFRNQVGQSVVNRRRVKELTAWADVLHVYTHNVTPLNVDLVRDLPLVVTADGTCLQSSQRFSFRYPGRGAATGRRLAQWVERRFLAHASLVIAQSEWARRSFIDDVGLHPDRVRTIRIGGPRPAAHTAGDHDGPRRVLYVGASMTRKGGNALIDALRGDLGPDLELHVVTRAAVPAVPHVVVHNDIRPGDGRIDRLLAQSDVLALPSDMDMSPNAVFEAMAYGLPVVSYASGGLPEMVEHGRSGYLAAEGDIAAVRTAVLALVADPVRAREFGEAGRRILRERFDPDARAAEFVDALHSV